MENINLEQALEAIMQEVTPRMEKEMVPVWECAGRILAEDMAARLDQPPFARAAMDGYAIRSSDSAGACEEETRCFRVIGETTAGDAPAGRIAEGEAVRVMTGAPLPEGADCVVRQEDTDYGEREMHLSVPYQPYMFYGHRGEDFHAGDILLQKGKKIHAPEAGLAAGMGYTVVPVYKRPVAAFFTTGDELMEPGEELLPGKIYDSNKYMLLARFTELGIQIMEAGTLRDSAVEAAEQLRKLRGKVDFIITTGAVSVGKKDIMHEVVEQLSAKRVFWRVNVKPGGAVMFAMYGDIPMLCLSGNPSGAAVHLELLGRPIFARLSQDEEIRTKRVQAVITEDYNKKSKIRRMVHGIYENGQVRRTEGNGLAGVMSSMRGHNCLIDIAAGNEGIHAGETVEVILL